jgi:hypothetical protein
MAADPFDLKQIKLPLTASWLKKFGLTSDNQPENSRMNVTNASH